MNVDDRCLFLREFTSGAGWGGGETNSLISNLKKNMGREGKPEWQYKTGAVNQCALELGEAFNHKWLEIGTLVPVPPSKMVDDPMYDPRINAICKKIPVGFELDVRDLVLQTTSLEADHGKEDGHRTSIKDLIDVYEINEAVVDPPPQSIAIVDDILTVGRHFQAVKHILEERFPDVQIIGVFIARRIFPTVAMDFDELE